MHVVIGKENHVDLAPLVLVGGVGLRLFPTPKPLFLVLCETLNQCLVLPGLARRILLEMGVEKLVCLEDLPAPYTLNGEGMSPVEVRSAMVS